MPLSFPSRATIRDAALIRLGFSRDGDAPNRIIDALNEAIQSAHTTYYRLHPWVRRRLSISETLLPGASALNAPDETALGQIEFIYAEDINGVPYQLAHAVPSPEERYTGTMTDPPGAPPRIWWIENDEIHITPPASDAWPTIKIQYREIDRLVKEDTDLILIDEELLVQAVVIDAKLFLGEDASREERRIAQYLTALRGSIPGTGNRGSIAPLPHLTSRRGVRNRVTGVDTILHRGSGGSVGPDGLIWPNGGPW